MAVRPWKGHPFSVAAAESGNWATASASPSAWARILPSQRATGPGGTAPEAIASRTSNGLEAFQALGEFEEFEEFGCRSVGCGCLVLRGRSSSSTWSCRCGHICASEASSAAPSAGSLLAICSTGQDVCDAADDDAARAPAPGRHAERAQGLFCGRQEVPTQHRQDAQVKVPKLFIPLSSGKTT